jgi:hypothetical protein
VTIPCSWPTRVFALPDRPVAQLLSGTTKEKSVDPPHLIVTNKFPTIVRPTAIQLTRKLSFASANFTRKLTFTFNKFVKEIDQNFGNRRKMPIRFFKAVYNEGSVSWPRRIPEVKIQFTIWQKIEETDEKEISVTKIIIFVSFSYLSVLLFI